MIASISQLSMTDTSNALLRFYAGRLEVCGKEERLTVYGGLQFPVVASRLVLGGVVHGVLAARGRR